MTTRKLAGFNLNPVGLGCMGFSHVYGDRPSEDKAIRVINEALDLGCNHLDTAALYGFGANERLVHKAVGHRRNEFMLASKCGLRGVDGQRELSGHPKHLRQTIEQSLRNLQVEHIDLYYLHRLDPKVPIEDSVGEMSRFVEEGKVGALGLSEMSAQTLRKAHSVHPIAAMQTEYSLWTRNPEIAVLQTCAELGAAFVAFSPLARAFLTHKFSYDFTLEAGDLRLKMPRFLPPHWEKNKALLMDYLALCTANDLSPAQVALGWVLAQGEHIHVIPGTTKSEHLRDDLAAARLNIPAKVLAAADELINQNTVSGPRYNAKTQLDIDTEEF